VDNVSVKLMALREHLLLNMVDKSPLNNVKHFYYQKMSREEQREARLDPLCPDEMKIVVLRVDEDFPTFSIMQPVKQFLVFRFS